MILVAYIAVLFLCCSAEPKSPRIYNVLISSKKNLAPSHAQPVYEPVLRTTSIGYAFPSLFYHTTFLQNVPTTYISADYSGFTKLDGSFVSPQEEGKPNNLQLPKFDSQLPFNNNQNVFNPSQEIFMKESHGNQPGLFPPEYDPNAPNFANYLPEDQNGATVESGRTSEIQQQQEETDPKKIIANLKKNPEIPDVPPPPLPVKTRKSA